MKLIRRKMLSMLLAISLVLGMATGTFAVSDLPSNTLQRHYGGLIGFDGEYELRGDGSLVQIIVELVHQPAELERALGVSNDRSTFAVYNADTSAENDRREFLKSLDELSGQLGRFARATKAYAINASYTSAINGFAITVPDTLVPKLVELDSVYAIYPDEEMQVDLGERDSYYIGDELYGTSSSEGSINQLGMADSRKYYEVDSLRGKGLTGKGVAVGIIDSGIDYNHPDLAGAFSDKLPNGENPEEGELLNGKFYGRNYIANGKGKNDPMDDHGHGTHVSGTVAGRGVNTPISALGIAPGATLVGYKVINSRDSVQASGLISAMEDAIKDGCEIINMSLGWSFENGPIHITTTAVNNLALVNPDVLFIVAAGNSGPNYYTLGSPSTSPLVMTVANAQLPSSDKKFTFEVNDEKIENLSATINLIRSEWNNRITVTNAVYDSVYRDAYELHGEFLKPTEIGSYKMLLLPVTETDADKNAWVNLATGTKGEFDSYSTSHSEKYDWSNTIVVLRRGQGFDDTVRRLRELGGGAIIVINNEGQDYTNISFYQQAYNDYLPVFTASHEVGMNLIKDMSAGQEYEITFTNVEDLGNVSINMSSSRGPVKSTYDVRPDITASGTSILSTVPQFYTGVESYDYSFAAMTGTSMATPHMAAFVAILKQQHPDWNAVQLKAHLANTANPTMLNQSVYTQGTGMVQPRVALDNSDFYTTATNRNAFYRTSTDELVRQDVEGSTISFGVAQSGKKSTKTVPVTLNNDGSSEATFDVIIDMQTNENVKVVTDKNEITVSANNNSKVKVEVEISSNAATGIYEGYLVLTQRGTSNPVTLRLPFAVYIEVESTGPAYNEEFTFIQAVAISNGENRHITNVMDYTSSDSKVHYQFLRQFDYFEVLIADSNGNIIGSASGKQHPETGVGGNWYYWGLISGGYYPYVENDGKIALSDTMEALPEGHYKLVLHPQKLFSEDNEYFEMDFVVDNTLPEITLTNLSGSIWHYTIDGDDLVLTGEIFDQGTKEMQDAGINSVANYRVFGRETSQQDNVVVVKVEDEYYRATIEPDGKFTVRIPASVEVDTATIYYGDHFLPVGQEWPWGEDQAVESFSPDKLSYKIETPTDPDKSVPWMYYYAYRAANKGELLVKLVEGVEKPTEPTEPTKPEGGGSTTPPIIGGGTTPSSAGVPSVKEESPVYNNKQVELKLKPTVKSGTAVVTVNSNQFNKVVDELVRNKADKVVIIPEISEDNDFIQVQLPKDAQVKLAESGASLVIESGKSTITIPSKTLGTLGKGVLDVKISVQQKDVAKISVKLDGKEFKSLAGGLEVILPAEATDSRYVAVLQLPDGSQKVLRKSVILSNGDVYTKLTDLGTVKVILQNNDFVDADKHQAKDAIAFVVARGLFMGKTETSFGPNDSMTRGMLVTVLNRLEDEIKSGDKHGFTDVSENAYYADAVSWATEKGIVSGIGNGKFAPEISITREQLATMLYQYAKAYDYALEGIDSLEKFSDGDSTSSWAQQAMSWCVGNGIINGNGNGMLRPTNMATRAEVAIILQQFIQAIAK